MVSGYQMQMAESNGTRHRDRWTHDGDTVSLMRGVPPEKPIRFTANPQPLNVDLNAAAFVIVDMQNDFLHPDGWFADERDVDVGPLKKPVPVINALSAAFRQVNVPVVHLNWGVRADVANLPANVLDKASAFGERAGYGERIKSGKVLVAGEWGAQSVSQIDQAPQDLLVHKHRFSGFRDNEFDQILRRLGVRHLFFAGVNIDRCVFATLMDAAFEGYDPILIEDACATVSPDYVKDATLYLVRLLYGFSTSSQDLLGALQATVSTDRN